MLSARNVHFISNPMPPATDHWKQPLLYWEKVQDIKKLGMVSPSLGLAGSCLIRYLPITVSIDLAYTLTMSWLADHPTIVCQPLKKFNAVGLEPEQKLPDGTPAQLLLSGTLQARLSLEAMQESPVSAWVLLEQSQCSPLLKSSLLSTPLSALGRGMRSHSSSTISERSTTPQSPGQHQSGRPLRNPRTQSK
jgi:hypothetical protein